MSYGATSSLPTSLFMSQNEATALRLPTVSTVEPIEVAPVTEDKFPLLLVVVPGILVAVGAIGILLAK